MTGGYYTYSQIGREKGRPNEGEREEDEGKELEVGGVKRGK